MLYTCQLSHLRHKSLHSRGLKILISWPLTFTGQIPTPDWKMYQVCAALLLHDTISKIIMYTQTDERNEKYVTNYHTSFLNKLESTGSNMTFSDTSDTCSETGTCQGCFRFCYANLVKINPLKLLISGGSLQKFWEVFGNRQIYSCHLRKTWHSNLG